jgi:hypothetical protein
MRKIYPKNIVTICKGGAPTFLSLDISHNLKIITSPKALTEKSKPPGPYRKAGA